MCETIQNTASTRHISTALLHCHFRCQITENLPDDLFVSWNVLELQPRPQPAARCPVSHKMARVC